MAILLQMTTWRDFAGAVGSGTGEWTVGPAICGLVDPTMCGRCLRLLTDVWKPAA